MSYHITNLDLTVCFDCTTAEDNYFEFEDKGKYENAPCPQCKGANTLPKYYLEQMAIPQLQAYLSEMAEITDKIPLLEYNFKDFKIPGAIICHHTLSQKYA